MDAGRCPWFAALRRTARIGGHVFLAEHRPGEARGGPALDCAAAGAGRPAVATGRPVAAADGRECGGSRTPAGGTDPRGRRHTPPPAQRAGHPARSRRVRSEARLIRVAVADG